MKKTGTRFFLVVIALIMVSCNIARAEQKLIKEVPKVDDGGHVLLKGEAVDWTMADLGIEYQQTIKQSVHKVEITRIRLGTWASRSGLRAGDQILNVEVKRDSYEITIDRDGKTYQAHLSKLEGTKLATKTDDKAMKDEVTRPGPNIKPPPSQIARIVDGTKIYTEVNLALCVPEPQDGWGRGQWDLLAKERSSGLGVEWGDWVNSLRKHIDEEWPHRLKDFGTADIHVTFHNGVVYGVELTHNTKQSDFADKAMSYLRSLNAPFPKASQVSEIHVEVKLSRTGTANSIDIP